MCGERITFEVVVAAHLFYIIGTRAECYGSVALDVGRCLYRSRLTADYTHTATIDITTYSHVRDVCRHITIYVTLLSTAVDVTAD